ncbi:MAG: DUF4114 domain-containing protein, partial [Arcobacteraceae bacterium]|nr:DUF4114 domain-containing protein [Arcobacteraceae bacterium]
HVICKLENGTTIKIDEYGGDVKDYGDCIKYFDDIEAKYGSAVETYVIKASTGYYDTECNSISLPSWCAVKKNGYDSTDESINEDDLIVNNDCDWGEDTVAGYENDVTTTETYMIDEDTNYVQTEVPYEIEEQTVNINDGTTSKDILTAEDTHDESGTTEQTTAEDTTNNVVSDTIKTEQTTAEDTDNLVSESTVQIDDGADIEDTIDEDSTYSLKGENGLFIEGITAENLNSAALVVEDKGLIFENEEQNLAINVGTEPVNLELSFQGGQAGHANIVGWYSIDSEGNPVDPQILKIVDAWINGDAGSYGSDMTSIQGAVGQIGFFIIDNGANQSNIIDAIENGDTISFVNSDDDIDVENILFTNSNGDETASYSNVFFSTNAYNNDDQDHALAGLNDTGDGIVIAFEDLPGTGDKDYDDFVFEIKGCTHPIADIEDTVAEDSCEVPESTEDTNSEQTTPENTVDGSVELITTTITESTPVTTNLTFVMDVSSSMSNTDIDLSEDAINSIVSQYEALGGVNVNIVQFWVDNAEASGWQDGTNLDADGLLYKDKGGTDPEQGMRQAIADFADAPSADQNIYIQMGDGSAYGDYEDDFEDYLSEFQSFINENMDSCLAVGINVSRLSDFDQMNDGIDGNILGDTIYADDIDDLSGLVDDIASVVVTEVVDIEAMQNAGYQLNDAGQWFITAEISAEDTIAANN